jgi:hypothetical protein
MSGKKVLGLRLVTSTSAFAVLVVASVDANSSLGYSNTDLVDVRPWAADDGEPHLSFSACW